MANNETLAGYMVRIGEMLKKGEVPREYMDVSGLYQLAMGNPNVEKAMNDPAERPAPESLEALKRRLEGEMDRHCRALMDSLELEPPKGWTASRVAMEAARRAGCISMQQSPFGAHEQIDPVKVGEKIEELNGHIRDIVREAQATKGDGA